MTLAEIMRLALRQLDEDPADISDFADLFRRYANEGYHIAVSKHYRPREVMGLRTDDKGEAYIDGLGIVRLISLQDDHDRSIMHELSLDGSKIMTGAKDTTLTAVAEISYPALENDTDEPRIPEFAHMALVDYVCYRHLMAGNAAKQSRAMLFYQQFNRTMYEISPQGCGSTTRFRNLYAATDIRRRW